MQLIDESRGDFNVVFVAVLLLLCLFSFIGSALYLCLNGQGTGGGGLYK